MFILLRFPIVNYLGIIDSARNTKCPAISEMTKLFILLRFPHSKLFEDHGFGKKHEMSRNSGDLRNVHFIEVSHTKFSDIETVLSSP